MVPTVATPSFSFVMTGLVPVIHDLIVEGFVDDRVKPGHDGWCVRR
jgi:hypothetical protein